MAAHPVADGAVGSGPFTLVASTVDTVTFANDLDTVQVMSDGTDALYYTFDGSTPTVGGTNCYALPAGAVGVDERSPRSGAATVVKLVSAGTPTVHVQRGD